MIRFLQMFALRVKYRRGKAVNASVYFTTSAVNQYRDGQVSNHRLYATAPQGISVVCKFLHFVPDAYIR